ncbi:hypothetical protein [Paenibacillus xylanilyticus]|uniref:hypothetical protein n=1 Tax=Paenibacillus xylanilyticus TaxID=248903 RepID=UPI00129E6B63|nr:hypothetical protein [Paenibacillus xylanilyticus]
MNKAIKRIFATSISAASIFGVASSAFAKEVSLPAPSPVLIKQPGNETGAPFVSDKLWSINFDGSRTSDSKMLVVSDDIPWLKVQMKNSGTTKMIVTITQDSPQGKVWGILTIAPGESDNLWGKMPLAGTFYVNFTSTGTLKGASSTRIASTYEELGL